MLSSKIYNNEEINICLPTLYKNIIDKKTNKYTKYGIFEPNDEEKKYIKKLEQQDTYRQLKVIAIIENTMLYECEKLQMVNYIYLSNDFNPYLTLCGVRIKSIVVNRTWNIVDDGEIEIDEINGNIVRIK